MERLKHRGSMAVRVFANNKRDRREDRVSMKIRRRKDGKLNNAGMSLVEIVVAMFILSVVTVTILSILVYSIRLNFRSRTRQQSTAAAQTVMENFKAYSVEEICEQFAHLPNEEGEQKKFNVSGDAVTTQIMRVSSLGGESSFTPANSEQITEVLSSGDGLNFQIHNMKYQNELYDVKIELTGHTISAADARTADVDTLIVENFTSANSAAYVGDASMDAMALSRIAGEVAAKWTEEENSAVPAPATPVTHDAIEVDLGKIKITNREIKVQVKKDGDKYVAVVSCAYIYRVDGYSYDDEPQRYEFDYWDNTEGKKSKKIFEEPTILKNLALYYYPAYKDGAEFNGAVYSRALKIENDKIIVENDLSDNPEIKCYIYKQKNLDVSDTRLASLELGYHLQLSLGTNVNIYDDNLDTILGSPTSVHSYDPTGSITNRYHGIGYMAANPSATTSPDSAVEKLRLMYDITVSVYRKGDMNNATASALNVLKSTIIE